MNLSRLVLASLLWVGCTDYSMTGYTIKTIGDTGGEGETEGATDENGDGSSASSSGSGSTTSEDDCDEVGVVMDVDSVSTLQDAFGLPMVRDGLTLDGPNAPDGWRPTTVDVLVMLPDWYFDWYADEDTITIEVYDSATPTGRPWRLAQRVRKSQLDWEPLRLPADADWSGDDRDQIAAWMSFDFSDQIPSGSFVTPELFVAVGWDGMGFPNVGYSNFELPCEANWTDYGDGRWSQNSGRDCSWPMMRIQYERIVPDDCE